MNTLFSYFSVSGVGNMAEPQQVAKAALKKLEDQLTCAICLDPYKDPKLLQCFHVFCKKCLEPLVVQDRQGLSLRCPNCRQSTLLPPASVSGLQPAFYISHLFEIQDALEKVESPQQTKCEKCKDFDAVNFCRTCGQFICADCSRIHKKWEEFTSHEVVSMKQLQSDVTKLVPPRKTTMICPKHKGKELELYCETCGELICHNCTVRLHQGHQYDLVSDTFQKHKGDIQTSVKKVEEQQAKVDEVIQEVDARCGKATEEHADAEEVIEKAFKQAHEMLAARKTELIAHLDRLTQQRLKTLAAQKDQAELIHTRLSSCLAFVHESLRTGSEGEILAMKTTVVKRIQEIAADFKPGTLLPEGSSDPVQFSGSASELTKTCQRFGKVYRRSELVPVEVSGSECYSGITVSSSAGSHTVGKLTDGSLDTWWESCGRKDTHWIRIHMGSGVVLKELTIAVDPAGAVSYVPKEIAVCVGNDEAKLQKLKSATIPCEKGTVVLLENLTKEYRYIQFNIKKCHDGGYDTRIRALYIKGTQRR